MVRVNLGNNQGGKVQFGGEFSYGQRKNESRWLIKPKISGQILYQALPELFVFSAWIFKLSDKAPVRDNT